MANTEQDYLTQEQFDASAHGNLRSMFEHLLLTVLEEAGRGTRDPKKVAALLETFDNTSNSNQRLVGLLRREQGKRPRAALPCEAHLLAVLSTGHLPEEEARSMEETPPEDFPFIVSPFEEGWFVSCASCAAEQAEAVANGPYAQGKWPNLKALREWAAENGCQYLMLDRDADKVPSLPSYDW